MADFQKIVLSKLDSLETGQEEIKAGMDKLESRVGKLESGQAGIKAGIEQNRKYINQAFEKSADFYNLKNKVTLNG